MNDLQKLLAERISVGLKRKTITSPSKFAENYRIMAGDFPGPWSFKYYPWTRDMHDSRSMRNVGMKAAQVGYTETMLNIVFFTMDVKGKDCLYVLPSKTPDATDFSASRFGAALELSPHLAKMYTDVNNIGHKRAGAANLYIRGSQSKSGLRSIPVALLVLDEVSIMNAENIALALARVDGQLEKQIWMISTPTIAGENIDKEYKLSTQNHFHYKCPGCSRWTEFLFPESVVLIGEHAADPRVRESYYICKECKVKVPYELHWTPRQNAEAKAEFLKHSQWIPTYSDRDTKGWWIPQIYSPTVAPGDFALSYFKGLTNPADEQEFYNSKLGQTHSVEGSSVTDEEIQVAKRNHKNTDVPRRDGLITMGIDVGNTLHVEICSWFLPKSWKPDHPELAICKVMKQTKIMLDLDFAKLDEMVRKYDPHFIVIDSQPERRAALSFANRFYGRVKLCFYAKGITGKTINVTKDDTEHIITVDRTSWLDLSLGRFKNKTIHLPLDVDQEYKDQIKVPTRVYRKDSDGNPVSFYDSGTRADHYAHARNYAEIALAFAIGKGRSENMGRVV